MKKIILSFITIGLINFCCLAQGKKSNIEIEAENWTKELVKNNKIFYCTYGNEGFDVDENLTIADYLGKMTSSESDFNNDGIKDGLFYYYHDSCGGTANYSDTAMFVYSENGKFIVDKNFTQTIIDKIKKNLSKTELSKFEAINVKFKGLGNTVIGVYSVWVGEDSNGFPSINGAFEYSPDSEFPLFETNRTAE